MVEELQLNRLIKDAFEAEKAFDFVEPVRNRRRLFLYWVPPSVLAAASLAVVAIFQVLVTPTPVRVSDAIQLLSEVDGLELEEESPESMLLAWQEAPLFMEVAVDALGSGL